MREKTSLAMVAFLKKALSVDPAKRFKNAGEMLAALEAATPRKLRPATRAKASAQSRQDWVKSRRDAFGRRYGKVLSADLHCADCGEPIAESMTACPWCGSRRNRFDKRTRLSHVCPRCRKGMSPAWRYCPWCYGPGFEPSGPDQTGGLRYHGTCRHCRGRLMRFMRYCPWCRRKVSKPWRVRPFPEVCGRCGWSVDSNFWRYCPWCEQTLL